MSKNKIVIFSSGVVLWMILMVFLLVKKYNVSGIILRKVMVFFLESKVMKKFSVVSKIGIMFLCKINKSVVRLLSRVMILLCFLMLVIVLVWIGCIVKSIVVISGMV